MEESPQKKQKIHQQSEQTHTQIPKVNPDITESSKTTSTTATDSDASIRETIRDQLNLDSDMDEEEAGSITNDYLEYLKVRELRRSNHQNLINQLKILGYDAWCLRIGRHLPHFELLDMFGLPLALSTKNHPLFHQCFRRACWRKV